MSQDDKPSGENLAIYIERRGHWDLTFTEEERAFICEALRAYAPRSAERATVPAKIMGYAQHFQAHRHHAVAEMAEFILGLAEPVTPASSERATNSEAGPITKEAKRLLRPAIESNDPITRANACNEALKVIKDFEAEAVAAVSATSPQFTPTHRHAEGGLYRVIGMMRIQILGIWHEAVEYENAQGMRFARRANEFASRFTAIDASTEGRDA